MNDERPWAVDLCCGLAGWTKWFLAEGYRVTGYDIDPRFRWSYPGEEFVQMDVRRIDGSRFRSARAIVASPPCNEFSKINDMAHRRKGPPNTSLVEAVWRIREESGVPTVLENVDRAQAFIGKAVCHRGPFFLWGDVPFLPSMRIRPKFGGSWRKSRPSYKDRGWSDTGSPAERAEIPLVLSRAVARGML